MLNLRQSGKLLFPKLFRNNVATAYAKGCGVHHHGYHDNAISVRARASTVNDNNSTSSYKRAVTGVRCCSTGDRVNESPSTTTRAHRETMGYNGQVCGDDDGIACDSLLEQRHIQLAEIIWEYMQMRHTLRKSDLILVLGNNDTRVAKHAAQLWLDGYADYLMFSGYLGNLTEGNWTRPEYEVFREVALKMGVPADHILVEKRATNTGQNISYSYDVLKVNIQVNLLPLKSVILVQTPYMERRTYATFMKQWPEDTTGIRVHVTSPAQCLRQFPNPDVGSVYDAICIMLGCFQRILTYPAKGYQIPQQVPDNVINAYNGLANTGLFNRFLTNF